MFPLLLSHSPLIFSSFFSVDLDWSLSDFERAARVCASRSYSISRKGSPPRNTVDYWTTFFPRERPKFLREVVNMAPLRRLTVPFRSIFELDSIELAPILENDFVVRLRSPSVTAAPANAVVPTTKPDDEKMDTDAAPSAPVVVPVTEVVSVLASELSAVLARPTAAVRLPSGDLYQSPHPSVFLCNPPASGSKVALRPSALSAVVSASQPVSSHSFSWVSCFD
jgi:hypothetical protein